MLREPWDIGRWLFAAFHAGKPGLLPNYSEPQAPKDARKRDCRKRGWSLHVLCSSQDHPE